MANFEKAYEEMIKNEGGYQLHTVKHDRGGMTYAGIARKFHPDWKGWELIDNNKDEGLTQLVRNFYQLKFWDKMQGDKINNQAIAENLFDYFVNAGQAALKLAQIILQVSPDGIVGAKTLEALNKIDPEVFVLKFTLAKIKRSATICNKNQSQRKFMLGWVNRALKAV